jgi:hypothetical protein
MTEIVLSHESLKELSFVCSLPVDGWLNLLGSAIGQKPSVAARGAMQMPLPHCTALSTLSQFRLFMTTRHSGDLKLRYDRRNNKAS